jgi:hypothetical protein
MTDIDDSEHLRLRAAEMRSKADLAIHPETKQSLLRIADDFEILAARAASRQTHASPQPTQSAEPGQFSLEESIASS